MQKISLLLVVLLTVLVGCATPILVNTDYPEGINFSHYQTYRWHDAANRNLSKDEFLASELIDGRIHANVDTQLQGKGYVYSEQGSVDFLVRYKVDSEAREDLRTYGDYYDPWWSVGVFNSHSNVGYGIGVSNVPRLAIDHYLQASLVVDFVDASNHRLIWRGKAERRMPDQQSAEKRRETIERMVAKVLEDFPARNLE